MIIELIRDTFNKNETLGSISILGHHFGYTLEDRTGTRKVQDETAIPIGIYSLSISHSSRFKREMVLLERVPNYKGVRVHGGNSHKNTAGCILVAKTRDDDKGTIQGTLEELFTAFVRIHLKQGKVFLRISEAF